MVFVPLEQLTALLTNGQVLCFQISDASSPVDQVGFTEEGSRISLSAPRAPENIREASGRPWWEKEERQQQAEPCCRLGKLQGAGENVKKSRDSISPHQNPGLGL